MFKIPDWEDDVPASNTNFTKKSKNKKELTQKSTTQNGKEKKGKLIKSNQNKSPSVSHRQNGILKKSQKAFLKKEYVGTHNKMQSKVNKSFKRNSNDDMLNGSLLRRQKNEKNNEMMTRRLQNKSTKPNENIKQNFDNKNIKNQIKNNTNFKAEISKKSSTFQNIKNKSTDKLKVNKFKDIEEDDSLNTILLNNNNSKSNKRKRKNTESDNLGIKNFDSDKLDEIVINAKKRKINESLKNDENELFNERDKPRVNRKKEIFRKLLQVNSKRNHIEVKGNKLRERMLERLKAAQFRYLNEKLYTSSGSDAQQLFQNDPSAFQTYHQGYQQQVKKWPVNPLDVIVKKIARMPKTHTIVDMGCGEAALAKRIPHKVRSFDLVASAPDVEACDMAHTPLLAESIDVAVYCLALMGTDLTQYLIEANRVLKMGGHLLIAEVESRFEDVEAFTKEVQRLGFKLKKLDKSHKVFFFMEFTKIREPPAKKSKLPMLSLKPCLYKRR